MPRRVLEVQDALVREVLRQRFNQRADHARLVGQLDHEDATERLDRQNAMFPLPPQFGRGPSPAVACVAAVLSPPSPVDQTLSRRLLSAPEAVLADIMYTRHRGEDVDAALGAHAAAFDWSACWRHLLRAPLDVLLARPVPASILASQLGVGPLDHLSECKSRSCSLNRRIAPEKRRRAEELVVGVVAARLPCIDELDVACIGCGGFFAELVLLQRLREVGVRRLTVHLIEHQARALALLANQADVRPEVARGYAPAFHHSEVGVIEQFVDWLGKNFEQVEAHVYGDVYALLELRQHSDKPKIDLVLGMDPGADGVQIETVRWHSALASAFAGHPHCVSALVWASCFEPLPRLRISQRDDRVDCSWQEVQGQPWQHGPGSDPLNERNDQEHMEAFLRMVERQIIVEREI